ncbi:Membrane-bound hydrogenase subunit alpha [uncultured archaeon]|nr:Membrane-bound hydrogenase subunit alpha [uncultured archaeon]
MAGKTRSFASNVLRELPGCQPAARKPDGSAWFESPAAKLPLACGSIMRNGGIFDSAFAYPFGRGSEWAAAYVFRVPDFGGLAVAWSHGKQFHAVSGKIPAALWDERKMHEISGVEFLGLSDTRPIVAHPENARLNKKCRAVGKKAQGYAFEGTGAEGEFEIPVGPVHAGIIEPGHFRFHVSGEGINKMEARLSYLHRGIEGAAKGKKIQGAFGIVEQVSGDESAANSVAFAQAAESLAGINAPPAAQSLRLIMLEQERIYSHLADLGGIALDVGFSSPACQFLALRESMMRLNEKYFGNRFLRNLVAIGGIAQGMPREKTRGMLKEMESLSESLLEIESLTLSSSTFLDRAFSAGKVSASTAVELGLVGPAARASGISCDARKLFPYGAYRHVRLNEAVAKGGDALSRFMVKLNEIKESSRLIRAEIQRMPSGAYCASGVQHALAGVPEGETAMGICEAPRGSCTFLLQSGKGGAIGNLSIRTASFRNWRALERAVLSNIIADFPLINKSFNLSYSGSDL